MRAAGVTQRADDPAHRGQGVVSGRLDATQGLPQQLGLPGGVDLGGLGQDDDAGQPVTTTFADYLLPGATEVPTITALFKQTPSPLNPLGAKGAGEVSTIPTAAAVISAIEDALHPFGVRIAQTPITPAKLVELIRGGAR